MPEILTKHPDVVQNMLKKMGATCKVGNPNILSNCSSSNFCKVPNVGEFCIIGLDEMDKLTQFKIKEDLNGLSFDPECNNEYNHDWIGYVAAVLGPIAFLTEIMHVRKTRQTSGLSFLWLSLTFLVSSLWLTHSIINKIRPAAASSIIYLFLVSYMMYLKHSIEKGKRKQK